MTKKVSSITGQELREMFAAATAWLEKNAADIDELNVFPVPDAIRRVIWRMAERAIKPGRSCADIRGMRPNLSETDLPV